MLMVTKKELATAYSVHRNTFAKRLSQIGINKKSRLTPRDLEMIFEEFGRPDDMKKARKN